MLIPLYPCAIFLELNWGMLKEIQRSLHGLKTTMSSLAFLLNCSYTQLLLREPEKTLYSHRMAIQLFAAQGQQFCRTVREQMGDRGQLAGR